MTENMSVQCNDSGIEGLKDRACLRSHYALCIGLGSSVSIVTDYWLDGPGIESRWGKIFLPSRPGLGLTQPPVQWVPGLSWG